MRTSWWYPTQLNPKHFYELLNFAFMSSNPSANERELFWFSSNRFSSGSSHPAKSFSHLSNKSALKVRWEADEAPSSFTAPVECISSLCLFRAVLSLHCSYQWLSNRVRGGTLFCGSMTSLWHVTDFQTNTIRTTLSSDSVTIWSH